MFHEGEKLLLKQKAMVQAVSINAYGPRKVAMMRNLMQFPVTEWYLYSGCLDPKLLCRRGDDRVVLRLDLWTMISQPTEREAFADDWIKRYLNPVLASL